MPAAVGGAPICGQERRRSARPRADAKALIGTRRGNAELDQSDVFLTKLIQATF
jgi:hypothetical protein